MFATPSRAVRRIGVALATLMLAVGLTACSGDSGDPGDDSGKNKADNKPVAVEFDVPKGFSKADDVELMNPLAEKYKAQFYTMDDVNTLELIFVVSYVLDEDTDEMDRSELEGLVAGYVKKVGNEADGDIYDSVANGNAGFHRYIRTPDPSGDDIIRYDSDYFFKGNKMVQVGCQKKHEDAKIQTACEAVLGSLKF